MDIRRLSIHYDSAWIIHQYSGVRPVEIFSVYPNVITKLHSHGGSGTGQPLLRISILQWCILLILRGVYDVIPQAYFIFF